METADSRTAKSFAETRGRTAATAIGAVVGVVGVVVLFGWAMDVEFLTSLYPGWATMKSNTAMGFVLAGAALLLLAVDHAGRVRERASLACSAAVMLLGLLSLAEYAFRIDLGIDQLLFVDSATAANAYPGRMAVATALNFVMIATALLLNRPPARGVASTVAAIQAVLVMLSSYIAILGYVYNVSALYTVVPFSSVALHTALLFLMLGAGFMLKESKAGLMQLVTSPYSGGRAARRLLPYILLVPPALGWLGLEGERLGLFEAEFAMAVVVVANIVIFTAVILSIVESLDDADGVRQQEIKFRGLLESAPDAMVIVDKKGRIALVNGQAEHLFGYERTELIGQPVQQLIPTRYRQRHTEHVADFMAAPGTREMGSDRKLFGLRKDGTEIPIEVSLAPVLAGEDVLISSAIRDVTERRQAEKVLQELSTQNDMLLREMRHRVANSLQLIASILSLKASSVTSAEARLHLQNAHERVLSVAAVQHHLHDAGRGGLIQIGPYLSDLCRSLIGSITGDDRPIKLSVEGVGGETHPARAVNLGLIVTELVINAVKYAFPGEGQARHIVVSYDENGADWRLTVSDNGVGQSESEGVAAGKGGLGTSIVRAIARQLGGQLDIISGPQGMSVRVARVESVCLAEE